MLVFFMYTVLPVTWLSTALDGELPCGRSPVLVPDLLLSLSFLAFFPFGDWVPVLDLSLLPLI
jgi:hypothetical protein